MAGAITYGYEFVAMPAAAWDANLSLGEFRLLGYIIRHLHRIGEVSAVLSDEELLNGAIGKDFVRFDDGCGLTRNTIKMARVELCAKGLLRIDRETHTYSIPNAEKREDRVSKIDSSTDQQVSKIHTLTVDQADRVSKIDSSTDQQVSKIHTLTVDQAETPIKSSTIDTWTEPQVSKIDTEHLVSEEKKLPPIIPPSQQEEEVEPHLRASRTWFGWFGNKLITVHGGVPQGEVKDAYLADLETWERLGKRPTPEQLTEAMADALRWWQQQGNTGRPHKATLVLKRLRELVNPLVPLEAVSATETFTDPPPPTPEQYSARLAANSAKIAALQAEFQARQKGLVA